MQTFTTHNNISRKDENFNLKRQHAVITSSYSLHDKLLKKKTEFVGYELYAKQMSPLNGPVPELDNCFFDLSEMGGSELKLILPASEQSIRITWQCNAMRRSLD